MPSSERFEDLLNQFDQAGSGTLSHEPEVGDTVQGTLVAIGDDFAYVDLGGKTEGRMEVAALRDAEGALTAAVGDRIEIAVTGKDTETGTLLLGAQHGQKLHGIEELQRAFEQGLPVQGQVSAAVKGGLEVQVAGVRGFCPASQADLRFIEDLQELVGQRLDFRVTKLEGGRRPNLVLSRRALLEEEQQQRAQETRAQLTEGAVLEGTVTSVKDYGAFIDIGGIEGMVHVSELAHGHVKNPAEILSVGQRVEVSVLRIEPPRDAGSRERIALSIRALAPDPWSEAAVDFPIGGRVRGTVSRLQPFGAFVELAPGVDGLIHISELGAGRRIGHPGEVLQAGQTVEAVVLGVDSERRRISLSLDQDGAASPERPESARPSRDERGRDTGASTEGGKPIGSFGALLQETLKRGR
jgi:small subunit ribosomal protein S1